MKAAVLHQLGEVPTYDDFAQPIAPNDQQVLIAVRAASIKQLDLLKAAGRHYTQYASLPTVVGVDGVGVLDNGQRVYAMGVTGMMAGQALVMKNRWVHVPDGLDDALAAALPNALIGSDAALRYRAQSQPGQTILVNQQHLPTMFQLAADGKLTIDLDVINLTDIAGAWAKASRGGKRIVITV